MSVSFPIECTVYDMDKLSVGFPQLFKFMLRFMFNLVFLELFMQQ